MANVKTSFIISGLHCDACVKVIRMKVGKIEGVTEVLVDPSGRTEVMAERAIAATELSEALAGLGYQVEHA